MGDKFLSEAGWKSCAAKSKLRDNGLIRALAAYERLGEDGDPDAREGALDEIEKLAERLQKDRAVAAVEPAVDFLDGVLASATKALAAVAQAQKAAERAQAEEARRAARQPPRLDASSGDDEDEEEAALGELLLKGLGRVKSGAGRTTMEFVAARGTSFSLVIAKRITPKLKEDLKKATGASRLLPVGTVVFEDGKYVFQLDSVKPGLAKNLQKAIKETTGKTMPVRVRDTASGAVLDGDSDVEPAEGPSTQVAPDVARRAPEPGKAGGGAQDGAGPGPDAEKLRAAPDAWRGMRRNIETTVSQLKDAIRREFANEGQDLVAEIEQSMGKLDRVLDSLDHKLADSLARAHAARDERTRSAELATSREILRNYVQYVQSEELIAHMDANPFGVTSDLRRQLTQALTEIASAVD